MDNIDPGSAVCPPNEPSYKMILEPDINKVPTGPPVMISDLPLEVMSLIIGCIKADKQFKTLTKLARVNKYYYDLVIPTLYETVVVNAKNRFKVIYGHAHNSDVTTPTRKDIATTFTRLLILEDLPMARFSRSFTKLEEVRLGSGCLQVKVEEDSGSDDPDLRDCDSYGPGRGPSLLRNCLLALAPTSISTSPVRVRFQIEAKYNLQELECLLRQLNPPIPFIYEFYIQKITNSNRTALRLAYEHGGIVHYRLHTLFHGSLAWYIANQFDYLFYHEPAGQVYLSDVPTMVLTPEDYQAAGDNANEAAKRKIFNSISCFDSSILPEVRWTLFDTRVKLVGPGFRPSTGELIAVRNRGPAFETARWSFIDRPSS